MYNFFRTKIANYKQRHFASIYKSYEPDYSIVKDISDKHQASNKQQAT